jgi:glutathione S-transferase
MRDFIVHSIPGSPFGRAAIDHGEFRLYETQAILRYVDRVLPDPAFTPENPHAARLANAA